MRLAPINLTALSVASLGCGRETGKALPDVGEIRSIPAQIFLTAEDRLPFDVTF